VLAKALNVELTEELRMDLRSYSAQHLGNGSDASETGNED
jgi:hypothetical protein